MSARNAHRPARPGQLALLERRDPEHPEDDRGHLDEHTREVGLRGIAAARAAIDRAPDPVPRSPRRDRYRLRRSAA